MTHLNTSASRLETRPGLYKSMDHSRYNSSNTVMVNSASSFRPPPYTAKTSITIPNSLGLNMPSSGSPTKSMSSGSMSASISLSTSNAPLSLPSQTSRRLAPNSNNHSLGDIYLPNDSLGYSNNSSGSNTTNLTNLRWSEADQTKEVNLSPTDHDYIFGSWDPGMIVKFHNCNNTDTINNNISIDNNNTIDDCKKAMRGRSSVNNSYFMLQKLHI